MRNRVQLIAYADRLGGDIPALIEVLRGPFGGAYDGVHLLPFFTPFDGADAGFDPVDHTELDPRLGTWSDLGELATEQDVVVDVIVNHVSADSAAFADVRKRGAESPYAPMFLTMSSVFPDGATEADLARIYRPRPGLPFTPYMLGGERRLVWTTFTPQQVDIDVCSEQGRDYLISILDRLRDAGVSLVRMDAVGYAIKTAGTTCFMTPQTFDFIDEFAALAHDRGLEILVEIHSYYRDQIDIASRVDWVYDFALPPLTLYAAYTGDHSPLLEWSAIRPANAITVLDTHDGIGIVDVGPDQKAPDRPGLLTESQLDDVVEGIHEHTQGESRHSTGQAASNLDIYQVNATFYSALGCDDRKYIAARAVQFMLPGIPQVYYTGALAGANDMELLARTGVGRDINRHVYSRDDLGSDLARPVVQSLLALARWRNDLPAFDGEAVVEAHDGGIRITRRQGGTWAILDADLAQGEAHLIWSGPSGDGETTDLVASPPRVG
ncbi:MAG: sucrose phosphorylase [Candidatus Nanopelagicales bacterium]